MAPAVYVETERLTLRTVTIEDVGNVSRSWNLDGVPISSEEAKERIRWMTRNHELKMRQGLVHLCLAIADVKTQEIIGWCGLDHRDRTNPNPLLFYMLKESYRNRGLATEAARALLNYAFLELGLTRIDAETEPENAASKRVIEKVGMRPVDGSQGCQFTISSEEFRSTLQQ